MLRWFLGLALLLQAPAAFAADLPPPVTDSMFEPANEAEARLGWQLFWDPILSGNRNISCATCHHPNFATGDGVSLALGEGGIGLGPDRRVDPDNPPEQRIPRNAPALFNLGAAEFTVLFHDGRIEVDETRPSGLRTPLENEMSTGFANILSAQTMFPVLSQDEMAGHYSENEVSLAVRMGRITGAGGAWDRISQRVAAIDAYRAQFETVYPEIGAGRPIAFTDISNAIAAFIAFEWRSDDSLFDAVLRGEATLEGPAARGLELFYGETGCAACHAGPFLTDHGFHAMGQPQIGPGKAERFETHARDVGRMRVTNDPADAYRFRTPSLRNVALTAPYGHAGAFAKLDAFMRHHADPAAGLATYDAGQAVLAALEGADDLTVLNDANERMAIADAIEIDPVPLTDHDVAALVAFLKTLTDEAAAKGRFGIPDTVPSGLQVER
ncbi:MAG: methylamine utilization protein MauG [Roseitalea sp.]|jgi:cytochrome c peroxidase|nr:methylamine utilization protein MauG [Roseitalea sp.]MBO6723279.1 methylamine utilization protein MauG [Roseitalea sp.]MBO6742535.1 methylamine utilization protein MauG [Roseitalea sp.]